MERLAFYLIAALVAGAILLCRGWLLAMFKPDNYDCDPYGWIVNQTSHVALGVLIVLVAALVGRWLLGEYPYRIELFLIALAYVLLFELVVQPWNGADTAHDITFMGIYGAGGALLVFREVRPGQVEVSGDLWLAALVAVVVVLHLAVGAALRWR